MQVEAANKLNKTKKTSISATKVSITVGKSKTITMKNIKSKVKWSTSNKKVVSIKTSGKNNYKCKIIAKKSGSATIKAKVGKKIYKCKIIVKKQNTKQKHNSSEDDTSNETQHIFDEGTITKKATCTENGEKVYTCSLCKRHKKETIPALGHNKSSKYVIDEEPTCSKEGSKHNYCTRCKTVMDTVSIPMTAHTNKVDNGIAPTCTKTGLTDGAHCIVCNKVIKAQEIIPALGHSESTDKKIEKEATCGTDGSEYTYCTRCNVKMTTYVIPATGEHVCGSDLTCRVCKKDIYENATCKFTAGTNMMGVILPAKENGYYDTLLIATGSGATLDKVGQKYGASDPITIKEANTKIKTITIIPYQNEKISVKKDASYLFSGSNLSYLYSNLQSIDGLDNLDTSNVTNMNHIFNGCSSLTSLDLSSFDTSAVTDMSHMFYNCSSLTSLDLSSFDTSEVINMYYMFYNCKSLTSLDLTSFNTSYVTKNMDSMFKNASSLQNIYVSRAPGQNSGWNTKDASKTDMFTGCGVSEVTYKDYIERDGIDASDSYRVSASGGSYFGICRGAGFFFVAIESKNGGASLPDKKYTIELTNNKYGFSKEKGYIVSIYEYDENDSNRTGNIISTSFYKYSEKEKFMTDEYQNLFYQNFIDGTVSEAPHKNYIHESDWFFIENAVTDVKNPSLKYTSEYSFISYPVVWAMLYESGLNIQAICNDGMNIPFMYSIGSYNKPKN